MPGGEKVAKNVIGKRPYGFCALTFPFFPHKEETYFWPFQHKCRSDARRGKARTQAVLCVLRVREEATSKQQSADESLYIYFSRVVTSAEMGPALCRHYLSFLSSPLGRG